MDHGGELHDRAPARRAHRGRPGIPALRRPAGRGRGRCRMSELASSSFGTACGPVRFAVVGCGVIGQLHAEVLAYGEDTAVTALVDVEPAVAASLAGHLVETAGARQPAITTSLGEALDSDDVDAVAICLPSGMHAQASVPVLES